MKWRSNFRRIAFSCPVLPCLVPPFRPFVLVRGSKISPLPCLWQSTLFFFLSCHVSSSLSSIAEKKNGQGETSSRYTLANYHLFTWPSINYSAFTGTCTVGIISLHSCTVQRIWGRMVTLENVQISFTACFFFTLSCYDWTSCSVDASCWNVHLILACAQFERARGRVACTLSCLWNERKTSMKHRRTNTWRPQTRDSWSLHDGADSGIPSTRFFMREKYVLCRSQF